MRLFLYYIIMKVDTNKVVSPIDEYTIGIKFPFSYGVVEWVKRELDGRKWVSSKKYWIAANTRENINKLVDAGFAVHPTLLPKQEQTAVKTAENKSEAVNLPLRLLRDPFPFQNIGIKWLLDNNGRGLLADEMGLGKTMQALGWLSLNLTELPVVIVCPASLKYNWEHEIDITIPFPPEVQILSGKKPYTLERNRIFIINYDILDVWVDHLLLLRPKVLITDECHQYKNNKAKRTKAVKKLQRRCKHFIAISGTPITNRPAEFYNVLNMLHPTLFGNYWKYAQRYCGARHNGFGWDFSGATNTKELHDKINGTLMLRRKKVDVFTEMPEKTWSKIPIEIDNRKTYDLAEANFVEYLKQNLTERTMVALKEVGLSEIHINKENISQTAAEQGARMNHLVELEKLRQIAVEGKLEQAIKWIYNFLESGEKLIIFATHVFVIDKIMNTFKGKAVKIDGSIPTNKRQTIVSRFQTHDGTKIFVGNIKAAGVGLTLTASSNVLFLEYPWTPGELDQAIDRAHRIGQHENVTGHCFVARGTVEDKMLQLLDKKRQVLSTVLDGQDAPESSVLGDLLNFYRK